MWVLHHDGSSATSFVKNIELTLGKVSIFDGGADEPSGAPQSSLSVLPPPVGEGGCSNSHVFTDGLQRCLCSFVAEARSFGRCVSYLRY